MLNDSEIRPATEREWDDVVAVFGRRGNDPAWCWCRRFLDPPPEQAQLPRDQRDNRAALHSELLNADVPPGLIAYVDGRPVGWTRVGPRDAFAGVRGNRALARLLDPDPAAWWVTCFAVASPARGSGIGTSLLRAAAEFAFAHGAGYLEGHPVDVAALKNGQASASAVFTGTMAMFTAAGFTEIGRTFASRPVMRLADSRVR
jgi:GNAT superfamily N-acetyltransferase